MSWISKEHQSLYSKAFTAFYDDVKTASNSLIDKTGKILSTGYDKVKEGADYVDKKWHKDDSSDDNSSHRKNNKPDKTNNPVYYSVEDSDAEIDNSDDTDDYLVQMGEIFPDILIKLNSKNNNLCRIWIIDGEGNRKRVNGKIASYDYINKIIHKWFTYEKIKESDLYKWYPTEELYTAYRDSTPRKLNPLNIIIFRYERTGYKPHPYHQV